MDTGEQLCLACGLCCDGSLFDNVQLAADEDALKLKALGLPLKRSRARRPVDFFTQPCRALGKDCACAVYSKRPRQCRSFECQVFKDLWDGKVSLDAALRTVKQGKRKAEKARVLLRAMGENDERLSVGKRFRRVQRWVESGEVDEASASLFAELGLAMHQLDLLAHRKFYTTGEA